jgi:hypothetical protein
MRVVPAFLLVLTSACPGPYGRNAAVGAAITTGIAATAAGVSRAQGGCYAACPTGTTCNPATGLCDEIPCRGLCDPAEHCEITATSWKCMPGREGTPIIEVGRKAGESSTPAPTDPPKAGDSPKTGGTSPDKSKEESPPRTP